MKAKVISLDSKKEEQIREEMAMTPEQRMNLAFQLIELAIAFSPEKELINEEDKSIPWINLKLKNGKS